MNRRAIVGLIAGTAALALAAAAWWLIPRPPSADEAASRYLEALAAGDVEALAHLGAFTTAGDEVGERARAAFEGATGHVEEPEIEQLTRDGDTVGVRAAGDFAHVSRKIFFGLELRNGAWQLSADHLATADIATPIGDSVWVGDALVPAGTTALLPAVYPVSPAPSAVLQGGDEVAISNDAPVALSVQAVLSPDADAVAQTQFDAYVNTCTAAGAAIPDACGIVVPWGADLSTVTGFRYRIEAFPVLALDGSTGTFAATGGELVVTATGVTREGHPASVTYRDSAWGMRGTMVFSGDELVLRVW